MNERNSEDWDRLDQVPDVDTASGDQPLDYTLAEADSEATSIHVEEPASRRSAKGILVGIVVVALLLVAAAAAWWALGRGAQSPPPVLAGVSEPPSVVAPPAETDNQQALVDEPPAEPLPALSASDELVRRLVSTLSSHPRLAELLTSEALIDRLVGAVANVAYGEDPRVHLAPARPSGEFTVEPLEGERGAFVMAADSAQRFDAPVAMFVSLDTAGTVQAYRRLRPLFEESYAQLGLPGDFDAALRTAAGKLRSTPDVEAPLLRRGTALTYRFDDERLEGLSAAQKLLLRMGKENRRRLLAKLSEFESALPHS